MSYITFGNIIFVLMRVQIVEFLYQVSQVLPAAPDVPGHIEVGLKSLHSGFVEVFFGLERPEVVRS